MPTLGVRRAVFNEFNGVGTSCVLGLGGVVEIGHTVGVEHDVFQNGAVFSRRGKNGGLVVFGKVDEFRITTPLKIEHAVSAPTVLVVSDERSFWVGGQRCFAGS